MDGLSASGKYATSEKEGGGSGEVPNKFLTHSFWFNGSSRANITNYEMSYSTTHPATMRRPRPLSEIIGTFVERSEKGTRTRGQGSRTRGGGISNNQTIQLSLLSADC